LVINPSDGEWCLEGSSDPSIVSFLFVLTQKETKRSRLYIKLGNTRALSSPLTECGAWKGHQTLSLFLFFLSWHKKKQKGQGCISNSEIREHSHPLWRSVVLGRVIRPYHCFFSFCLDTKRNKKVKAVHPSLENYTSFICLHPTR